MEFEKICYLIPSSQEELCEYFGQMLTIVTEGNLLHIAHPNYVLSSCIINPDTKEVLEIDWNAFKAGKLREIDDCGRYSILDQYCHPKDNQLTFIQKRADHMLNRYRKNNQENYACPFVIIEEEFHKDEANTFFIRGIISCSLSEGYKFGFNPIFSLDSNKLAFQKSLSMKDMFAKNTSKNKNAE